MHSTMHHGEDLSDSVFLGLMHAINSPVYQSDDVSCRGRSASNESGNSLPSPPKLLQIVISDERLEIADTYLDFPLVD